MNNLFVRVSWSYCNKIYKLPLKHLCVLLFISFSFFSKDLFAQQPVTGKVSSSDSALAGATVQVKGTTIATQTNANGNFTINAAPNATLVISSIGYTSEEVKV